MAVNIIKRKRVDQINVQYAEDHATITTVSAHVIIDLVEQTVDAGGDVTSETVLTSYAEHVSCDAFKQLVTAVEKAFRVANELLTNGDAGPEQPAGVAGTAP